MSIVKHIMDSNKLEGLLILEEGHILYCNKYFLEIFNYESEKEVKGLDFYNLAPEQQPNGQKTVNKYYEMLEEVDRNRRSSCELQMKTAANKLIWIKLTLITGKLDNKQKTVAVMKDITKQKEKEQTFIKEKNKYLNIFNNEHTPMLIIDSFNGKIEDANDASCSYYGFSKEKLRQMNISQINMLSDKEIEDEMLKAKREERKYFRFKHKLSSGEIRDVEVYSGPIHIGDKQLLLSIIHDIQEKNKFIKKLKIQESYFKDLFDNSPEAIAMVNNEFKIMDVNKSFEETFRYKKQEVINKNITEVLCEEEYYNESLYFKDCVNKGQFIRKETVRRRKDGKQIEVSLMGCPIMLNYKHIGAYCIYSDLSRIREVEDRKRLFTEIFENNTVGVVITDIDGRIQWINNAFTEITGYSHKEVEGKKTNILTSGKHNSAYYENIWNNVLTEGKWQGEVCSKKKSGELFQEWLNIFAVRNNDDQIEYLVGMINDITDAKQKEKRIEILTNKDHLTHLYNRSYFIHKLNYLIRNKSKEEKMALLFLDIDDFKEINDNLGHLMGDQVLKEFAVRLKGCVRQYDRVARFGGDEFIILLTQVNDQFQAVRMAKRILDCISGTYCFDENELHITASIGISRFPEDGTDSNTLLKNADIAMYRAKESKNEKITIFQSELKEEAKGYFQLKNQLRQAIARDQLFLKYQPILDVEKEKLIGVEALLRWRLPNDEIVSPSTFIPIAEKSGLIGSIGEWVLEEVCYQLKKWQIKGLLTPFVAINVSVLQLEQPYFHESVKRILDKTGVNPELLQFEITETIFTKNYEMITQAIKDINQLGVKIAIDDFGTGYSSFAQLIKLDIAKLKIDQSFIRYVNENINTSKVVKAIISMAESLNLELIAEGVETNQQLDFLKENQCKLVQGYLFSRPVSAKDVEAFFETIE